MADKNRPNRPGNGSGKPQQGGQPQKTEVKGENKPSNTKVTSNPRRSRNIAIATGIAIALILALLAFAFLVASISNNNSQSTSSESSSTTSGETSSNGSNGSSSRSTSSRSSSANTSNVSSASSSASSSNGSTTGTNTGSNRNVPSRYRLTAGRGDSVSTLARRAMNQYLKDRGEKLDRAQRLFFEVNLMRANNPRAMRVGETRSFSTDAMEDLFIQADNMSGRYYRSWNNAAVRAGYR